MVNKNTNNLSQQTRSIDATKVSPKKQTATQNTKSNQGSK